MSRIAANAGCPQHVAPLQPPCVSTACAALPANYQSCPPCDTDLRCCYTDLSGFDVACREVSLTRLSEITIYNLDAGNSVTVERVHINAGNIKRFAASGMPPIVNTNPTIQLSKGVYRLCAATVDADTKFSVEPV